MYFTSMRPACTLRIVSLRPESAMMITTNYSYDGPSSSQLPYHLSRAIPGDDALHKALTASLNATLLPIGRQVHTYSVHASADCFCESKQAGEQREGTLDSVL